LSEIVTTREFRPVTPFFFLNNKGTVLTGGHSSCASNGSNSGYATCLLCSS
jgi:hypothetical protein